MHCFGTCILATAGHFFWNLWLVTFTRGSQKSSKIAVKPMSSAKCSGVIYVGVNPKIGGFFHPQNGSFIMVQTPIKMDDLGGFTTPIFGNTYIYIYTTPNL